jgi:hypothetical protein
LRQGRGDSVGAAGVKGAFEQARSRMVKLALEAGTAIAQLSNKKG